MFIAARVLGLLLILVVLWDAFETIVLPRRVTRRWRLARGFYRVSWKLWSAFSRFVRNGKKRVTYLSYFGPLSLLMLFSVWALTMVTGFAFIQWSLGSKLGGPAAGHSFLLDLYFSGSTFFTLGLGDLVPQNVPSRFATILEAGLGLGFLAMVVGYLPVIYQAFSRRESQISLMDARAGSPSAAVELLLRQAKSGDFDKALSDFLSQWERWSADVLESHLSYPVLAYYRSQHDNQSWLGALTTVLDASAVVLAGMNGPLRWQAQLTFAIARHAVVDLSQVFKTRPLAPASDRLPHDDFMRACEILAGGGIALENSPDVERKLRELRRMYESYVNALSEYLGLGVPPWLPSAHRKENWLTSAWEHAATAGPGI